MSVREEDVAAFLATPDVATEADVIAFLNSQSSGAGRTWQPNAPQYTRTQAALTQIPQGVPFFDEIYGTLRGILPGGPTIHEAIAQERAINAQMEAQYPGTTALSRMGGALATPVVAGANLLGKAPGFVNAVRGGGLLSTMAAGAGYGALTEYADAEGNPIERLPAAKHGAKVGAIAGAGGAIANRALRAVRGPAAMDDIAESLARAGGKSNSAVEAAKRQKEIVSRTMFQPLEKKYQKVDDKQILEALKHPVVMSAVRQVIPKNELGRAPSFNELQSVRRRLQGSLSKAKRQGDSFLVEKYGNALDGLTDVMHRRLEGYAAANSAYRNAVAAEKAFDRGSKMIGKTPEAIQQVMKQMPDAAAKETFRQGLLAAMYDKLASKGGTITMKQVEALRSLGMRKRLRSMFADQRAYDDFMAQLNRNGRASVDRHRLVEAAKLTGIGGSIYGTGRIVSGLLE
jgi:hypothetical protein